MSDLKGRVIAVTGGTSGIGEAVARMAAAAGAKGVCIAGRDAKRGEAVAAELGKLCSMHFVQGDLADEAHCRAIISEAQAKLGVVDGLVNAAGLTDRGTIENTSVALWDRLFAVNARAPFILIQETVRRLKAAKQPGSIVNVITRSAHGGQPFLTPYAASKGALAVLTKNVAHSCRFARIRVNGIMMGWAETPGEHITQMRDGKPKDWLAQAEPAQPFGRILRAKDVAMLAIYLLSRDAEMMTGSLIDFDQHVLGAYD
jgi:NAD(P)-dependent dehydrogenase (short-subunit alcohol dehydrogenase family)